MEKISVVIPVYNVIQYLNECLNSVINQTYKNLEIILVDDGSTDGSGKICDEYAKKDNRIVVIHKENEGLGLTRNCGIDIATGKYIMFVDSDDYIAHDMIATLHNAAKDLNAGICKCGYTKVSDDHTTLYVRRYEPAAYHNKQVVQEFLPRFLGSSPKQKDSIEMCACMTLYSLDIIKENHIKFVSERQYLSEDIFFNLDFIPYTSNAYLSDYTGYYYRCNKKSLSKSYRPDRFESSVFMYKELRKRISGLNNDANTRLSRLFFIYIRGALAQENPKISHLSTADMRSSIKKICYNREVQNTIKKYPIQNLGIKQKLFLLLIKRKKIQVISVLIRLGII